MRYTKLINRAIVVTGIILGGLGCSPDAQRLGSTHVKSAVIDAENGGSIVVLFEDYPDYENARIDIPPNALAEDTHITIDVAFEPVTGDEATAAGPMIAFGPPDIAFAVPATLTLPTLEGIDPNELHVYMQNADGTRTRLAPRALDYVPATNTVRFEVSQLATVQAATVPAPGSWFERFLSRDLGPDSIAVGPDGGVVSAGFFHQRTRFGATHSVTAPAFAMFVVKHDPAGNLVFAKSFPAVSNDRAHATVDVAIDRQNHIVVAGLTHVGIDFGFGTGDGGVVPDAYIAKLDNTGTPLWSRHMGDDQSQSVQEIAIGPDNHIYGVINFSGCLSVDIAQDFCAVDAPDVLLVRWTPNGNVVVTRLLTGAFTRAQNLALHADDRLAIVGEFAGTTHFGGTTFTTTATHGFVAMYDHDLEPAGQVEIAGDVFARADGATFTADGRLVFGFRFDGNLTVDGQTYPNTDLNSGLAAYAPTGQVSWLHRFGQADPTRFDPIVLRPAPGNDVWLSAWAIGDPDFGDGPRLTWPDPVYNLVRLDPTGTVTQRFSTDANETVYFHDVQPYQDRLYVSGLLHEAPTAWAQVPVSPAQIPGGVGNKGVLGLITVP